MDTHNKIPNFGELLKKHGGKITPGRVDLLRVLWNETKPVPVTYLEKKIPSLDKVTLYRALKSLTESQIIREVDLRHGHSHYEFNILKKHHHHAICTHCGSVEDTPCMIEKTKKVANLKIITDHAVEFFGICNTCTVKKI